jgi:hypothetical protein
MLSSILIPRVSVHLFQLFCRYHELSNVCLGHLFTHQTFDADDSGVLGLAYIASPRLHAIGGICSFGYFHFIGSIKTSTLLDVIIQL